MNLKGDIPKTNRKQSSLSNMTIQHNNYLIKFNIRAHFDPKVIVQVLTIAFFVQKPGL